MRVGAVIDDLMLFSRIDAAASSAGASLVRVSAPADLPAELDLVLVDWSARDPSWSEALRASDARVSYAVLTDAGRDKLAQASRTHTAAVAQLFTERFDDTELEALALLLGRLPGAAEADAGSCEVGAPD